MLKHFQFSHVRNYVLYREDYLRLLQKKKVITAAIRSNPEWRASDSNPRLPVKSPIISLNPVKKIAANTDIPATRFFSLIIKLFASLTK
jgi:hypothetical protein